ncbi:MAG: response regulator [Verrucomicrobiota bacterium]|nr:response regulator [Verrucomicrobiota bacterium]
MKKRFRILTVENETALTQLMALVLCGPDCKVTAAADGWEALAKIDATIEPFDIVLTDHQMPRVTGLELVRQLRKRNFAGKIVVISAFLHEENTRAYQALGVDLMLAKPFDMDELRHAVDVLMDQAAVFAHRATG